MNALKSKERSTDRVIKLKPIEGMFTLSSSGLFDNRLFTGENRLHAIKDPKNNLWFFKYEAGGIPEPLKQKFSNFNSALKTAEMYYKRRNISIESIED